MARLGFLFAFALIQLVVAQSTTSRTSSTTTQPAHATTAANVTSIVTSVAVTRTSVSSGSTISFTTSVPTTIVSTLTPKPNTTQTASNATQTAHTNSTTNGTDTSQTQQQENKGPTLDTHVGPAFGVLGALLVLTGLPSAFLGHKNRWSSFFLTGWYTLSLVCLALILKFGVLVAVHPPSEKLIGLFVLACGVAGIAGGGISIFFWQQTKYFIGAWGGFAIGLWVQSFRNGGLIGPIGFRWIMYSACTTVGFVLCTIPKLHYHIMILGTAITGASAFMLGVDCFTTAGLKEFYVYNLGFTTLFPKFVGMRFPVSQTMSIEIGLIAAVALAGTAVQLRVLRILKRKLQEINEEEKRREVLAEEKAVKRFEHVQQDLDEWEKEHGSKRPGKSLSVSELSAVPLMARDQDEAASTPGSTTVGHHRTRTRSGLSEYAFNDENRPTSRFSQSPGILPAMNLGLGLDSELPSELISDDLRMRDPDLMRKEELLAEIQTIRKSIDALRSDGGSSSGDSRRPSLSHSRTLSGDIGHVLQAQTSSRDRVQSLNVLSSPFEDPVGRAAEGASIGRPVSAPLRNDRDEEWEAYVRERKLFQPPSGPSAPIAPTLVTPIPQAPSEFHPISDAVAEVLAQRRAREGQLEYSLGQGSDDLPLGTRRMSNSPFVDVAPKAHRRNSSFGPVNVLPPKQGHHSTSKPAVEPVQPRTVTYEELLERHQAKMRSLQEPVTRQEKEQAELAVAKSRWERSKAAEREIMTRKQAEKEATLGKRPKEERRQSKGDVLPEATARPTRPAGPGTGHTSSKRASSGKVLEWQKYQQEVAATGGESSNKDSSRRKSGAPNEAGGLPFPNTTTSNKRRSRAGIPPN
ncbi:hypothetical protein M422DRAFT_257009 [Sphaerobolus stellatus SS14]|uniref:TM7S3/TM198-like domain-containing protein n=1 Tax=Sphaerobolus stellatus (strain SS14) TaxID=990650 RepID=A0A0C9VQK2_SPHS4|nr:hypothetical protein M422DRAFT_257009 [Sphaerobolus stellatus SS14]